MGRIKKCPFGGKVQHSTKKKAIKMASKSTSEALKDKTLHAVPHIYKCRNCGTWHTTKQSKEEYKNVNEDI